MTMNIIAKSVREAITPVEKKLGPCTILGTNIDLCGRKSPPNLSSQIGGGGARQCFPRNYAE